MRGWRVGLRFASLDFEFGVKHTPPLNMTAKKKITTKTSPAPATKTAAPAAKKKSASKPVRAAAKPAPAPAAAPATLPPSKAAAISPVKTRIAARIDVGFGNALYMRGEGAGLSWDRGLLLSCVADDLWEIVLGESAQPILFKFLVNDLSWSVGPDYSVAAGTSVTLTPEF